MNDQITFKALNNVPDSQIELNRFVNRDRGIFKLGSSSKSVKSNLAVVGGGTDLTYFVDELKRFDGDIWAINGAYRWCRSVGIDAVFYAIDPSPLIVKLLSEVHVHNAILADTVHQEVFKILDTNVREIAWTGPKDIKHSTTAAATAPMIAAERGHRKVTFFGCQSHFDHGGTHVYKNDTSISKIWVDCGKFKYVTCPQFIMQAEFIAKLARGLPTGIEVKGNGFLTSLIENGKYKVTHVVESISEGLERQLNEQQNSRTAVV